VRLFDGFFWSWFPRASIGDADRFVHFWLHFALGHFPEIFFVRLRLSVFKSRRANFQNPLMKIFGKYFRPFRGAHRRAGTSGGLETKRCVSGGLSFAHGTPHFDLKKTETRFDPEQEFRGIPETKKGGAPENKRGPQSLRENSLCS
jgi:hypothetical protein